MQQQEHSALFKYKLIATMHIHVIPVAAIDEMFDRYTEIFLYTSMHPKLQVIEMHTRMPQ